MSVHYFNLFFRISKYCHFSAYDYVLSARGKITALTDIQIAVPEGCYGRVGTYSDETYF